MKMEILYVFVEGTDDQRFFERYYKGLNVKFILYAKEKTSKINSFIKNIKHIPHADYLLFADADKDCIYHNLQKMLSRYPQLTKDKLIIVEKEIESWYLAGLTEAVCRKLKITRFLDTNTITKEQFDNILPKRMNRIDFMIELVKEYSIKDAIECNKSFKRFVQKYPK